MIHPILILKFKEEFITIKENEEEEYNNDEDKFDKAEIHLEDIESYVNKYPSNKNNLKYFTKYELNKRLSDIIYSKILSINNFSIINEILHNTENFEKNKNIIFISSLYTYNGKNKNLKEKKK